MKLHFLGTCSGTEPMPGRHHTSWVLETEGRLYWFDAGEGCSYTGYLMGLDPMAITKIIISQRISSIATADKIIVLSKGKILAIGKHEELLSSCPTYAEINESQMGGAILD